MKKLNVLYPGQSEPTQTIVNTKEIGFDSWLQATITEPLSSAEIAEMQAAYEQKMVEYREARAAAIDTANETGNDPVFPDEPVNNTPPPGPMYFFTVESTDIGED